jgi:hypothetical protein
MFLREASSWVRVSTVLEFLFFFRGIIQSDVDGLLNLTIFDRINRIDKIFLNYNRENPEIHVDHVLITMLLLVIPRIDVLFVGFMSG